MTPSQIGVILADLCRLMNAWLQSIGVNSGVTDEDREYISWEKDRY
ncbi:hypothetical protein JNB62_05015 [Microbacterium jejuense]|uniref:Uncharacterized protein n=1 Tax=Microbacterium jejuense TaxID=1263637 RepID=A0ABS7HJY1_9MICO|nr:hypothetical protein [Microbacterium jejuense]MBW9093035.1 hypothetical protein [Microbacterium jejuense]